MRDFLRDPLDYLVRLRRYGKIVRVSAGPQVIHTLYDAGVIHQAFVDQAVNYSKRGVLDDLIFVLGDGLLSSEGESWKTRRHGLSPTLSAKSLDKIAPEMDQIVRGKLGSLKSGDEFDALKLMSHLALEIVGQTLFGVTLENRVSEISTAVEQVSRCALLRSKSLLKLPLWIPTPNNIGYTRAIKVLAAETEAIVLESNDRSKFMQYLKQVTNHNPQAIRDEVVTFLLAGHETTATTLAWAIGHLAQSDDLQDRARQEANSWLAESGPVTNTHKSLPFIDACISEALRLYPPSWLLIRRTEEDSQLLGFEIPKNSLIAVPVHALHRDPETWEEAEFFAPDRFLDDKSLGESSHYMPFGRGPRRCIGEGFARLEMRLILARLLANFRLELQVELPKPNPLTTLRPANPINIRIS